MLRLSQVLTPVSEVVVGAVVSKHIFYLVLRMCRCVRVSQTVVRNLNRASFVEELRCLVSTPSRHQLAKLRRHATLPAALALVLSVVSEHLAVKEGEVSGHRTLELLAD